MKGKQEEARGKETDGSRGRNFCSPEPSLALQVLIEHLLCPSTPPQSQKGSRFSDVRATAMSIMGREA